MRSQLAVLLLITLAGCPASHKRKIQGDSGGEEGDGLEEDAEVAPAEPDASHDASVDSGTSAHIDAGSDGASPLGVEIVSPQQGAEFYTFEDVPLRGACRGVVDHAALHASFVASGPGSSWRGEGSELSHRFDQPGTYTLELICRDAAGQEQRATRDLHIHPTPSIVYAGKQPGAKSEAVFAVRLDQLGQATQISPRSEALAAKIVDAQYNSLADRVLVRGNLFEAQEEVLAVARACRDASCAGQDAPYQALVPEAHACKVRMVNWSPDGRSVFASYLCAGEAASATSYWVDLQAAAAVVVPLGVSPSRASSDGVGDFTAGGDVLLFQSGNELKAMDTRAPDHPVVSLGSVEAARWMLSPARDRVLILGDKGYTLETSALLAQGAAARTEIAYAHGAPRLVQAGDTHLVYILERVVGEEIAYESRLMRWDGSHDVSLCTNCLTLRCGDRIMTRDLNTGAAAVLRIEPGNGSDIVTTPLPAGAPPASFLTRFDASCSLAQYTSSDPTSSTVIWDVDNGDWLISASGTLAPDGRHLARGASIVSVARSPLRVLDVVANWSSGEGGFTPDGAYYVFAGEHADQEGTFLIDLQTRSVQRLADRGGLSRTSPDGSRLLINVGTFDQRLTEYALSTRQLQWRTARGSADWASLHWALHKVPGSRAVAYRATLAADNVESLYRSDLEQEGALRFGAFSHAGDEWGMSPDGSLMAMRNAHELTLWSFRADGVATPLVRKALDASLNSCLTFEVSAAGLLCVGRGVSRLIWLDAESGKVGEVAPLPATGTYWGGTRGPDGGKRGMLFGKMESAASVSWLDFSDPAAPRIEPGAEPHAAWKLTDDRRYLLRSAPTGTVVTDLATGDTRALTRANERVVVPRPDEYQQSLQLPGRIVLSDGSSVFWVDLTAAVVTASHYVGRVQALQPLKPDLSRVLVLSGWTNRLTAISEDGQSTPLYQSDVGLMHARTSPDGRWVVYVTDPVGEEAAFLVPSDGSAPATRLASARVENAWFDRTGRYVAGCVLERKEGAYDSVWKVWSVDAPDAPKRASPAGFQSNHGWTPVWIQ